jgi:hypothetical protein
VINASIRVKDKFGFCYDIIHMDQVLKRFDYIC